MPDHASPPRTPHLELGLFLPNTRGGTIMATGSPPQRMPTFALNAAITRLAEENGFEFVLAQSKWRGYGGEAQHWDYSLEAFTLVSALAAVTSRIRLYASVGVRAVHPVVAAKMGATIDDVSGGRFGLNIVAGWNQHEYAQMGLWAEDDYHRYRYAYADEYLQVVRALWADGRATHSGRFFKLEGCQSLPTPAHPIPIVCAGQSEDALGFTARCADYSFVGRQADTPERLGELTSRLSALAAEQGRQVGSYMLLTVIARATEAEAIAERDGFVASTDEAGVAEAMRISGLDPTRATRGELRSVARTFMGMPLCVSSYAGVAAYLDAIARAGVTGVSLVFPDFEADLPRFIQEVVPLMESRGAPVAVALETVA
jgi:pyrimidine oxygenase